MSERKTILIVGLGTFGMELARALSKRHEIMAVDIDEQKVNQIADFVSRALILDARNYDSLKQAVTREFDEAVISLGDNMEASVLAALHLKKLGVTRIHARTISDDHATILRSVGATDIIFPAREVAKRVAGRIDNPNLLDFMPLPESYEVVEVAPPPSFVGKTLQQLKLRNRYNVFVLAIRQFVPEGFVFLPKPEEVIKPSDSIVVIGRTDSILRMRDGDTKKNDDGSANGSATDTVDPDPIQS